MTTQFKWSYVYEAVSSAKWRGHTDLNLLNLLSCSSLSSSLVFFEKMSVQIPDDSDFSSFKDQCLNLDGWTSRYNKGGVTVWCRDEDSKTVQKIKVSNKVYSSVYTKPLKLST